MTTATVTWPTTADLERAAQALGEAVTAVEDLGNFRDLDMALQSPLDEAPVPTVEQFAALSWFIVSVELEVSRLTHELEAMRQARDAGAYTWGNRVAGSDDAR